MIVSPHDVDCAYRVADRIRVFDVGRIIADDTPEIIFSREDVLIRANLRMPLMRKITEGLKERGILGDHDSPRTPEELQAMLGYGMG